jgi:hypothetical protein
MLTVLGSRISDVVGVACLRPLFFIALAIGIAARCSLMPMFSDV